MENPKLAVNIRKALDLGWRPIQHFLNFKDGACIMGLWFVGKSDIKPDSDASSEHSGHSFAAHVASSSHFGHYMAAGLTDGFDGRPSTWEYQYGGSEHISSGMDRVRKKYMSGYRAGRRLLRILMPHVYAATLILEVAGQNDEDYIPYWPMTLNEVGFFAGECARQGTGPMSVLQMAMAWEYAKENRNEARGRPNIWYTMIRMLGALVEPDINQDGFRKVPASFKDGSLALPHGQIGSALTNLTESIEDITPEEVYQEFESIHPFADGNGRVGAILYNLLLNDPEGLRTPPPHKKG